MRFATGLKASGGLAALLLPIIMFAQSAPKTYTTQFSLVENPISEGGVWAQGGGSTGLDWTNARTNGSIAYGTQTGQGGYDDSIALLSGFGPNYSISGTIHFVGTRSGSTQTHEVELILRGSYSAHTQHLYECNLGYAGSSGWYAQIIRMNGAIGNFTDIGNFVSAVPAVKDGDIFMAEINGNVISTYLNGVKLQTAVDSTYATGQPGMGFFWRGTENITDFGFTALTVTEIGVVAKPNPPTNVRVN